MSSELYTSPSSKNGTQDAIDSICNRNFQKRASNTDNLKKSNYKKSKINSKKKKQTEKLHKAKSNLNTRKLIIEQVKAYKKEEEERRTKLWETFTLKIHNHLCREKVMPIEEVRSLLQQLLKIKVFNKKEVSMRNRFKMQLTDIINEMMEIEESLEKLHMSDSEQHTYYEDTLSKHVNVGETITSDLICTNERDSNIIESANSQNPLSSILTTSLNINQNLNTNDVSKDLRLLKEIDAMKQQDYNADYEAILMRPPISFSFDEEMLTNLNFENTDSTTPNFVNLQNAETNCNVLEMNEAVPPIFEANNNTNRNLLSNPTHQNNDSHLEESQESMDFHFTVCSKANVPEEFNLFNEDIEMNIDDTQNVLSCSFTVDGKICFKEVEQNIHSTKSNISSLEKEKSAEPDLSKDIMTYSCDTIVNTEKNTASVKRKKTVNENASVLFNKSKEKTLQSYTQVNSQSLMSQKNSIQSSDYVEATGTQSKTEENTQISSDYVEATDTQSKIEENVAICESNLSQLNSQTANVNSKEKLERELENVVQDIKKFKKNFVTLLMNEIFEKASTASTLSRTDSHPGNDMQSFEITEEQKMLSLANMEEIATKYRNKLRCGKFTNDVRRNRKLPFSVNFEAFLKLYKDD